MIEKVLEECGFVKNGWYYEKRNGFRNYRVHVQVETCLRIWGYDILQEHLDHDLVCDTGYVKADSEELKILLKVLTT